MSLSACNIMITQQAERAVFISRDLSRQLQLTAGRPVTVRLGSKTVTAPVRILSRTGRTLLLSASLAAALRLPGQRSCLVKNNGGRELQIGPLIGILTGADSSSGQPFGSRTEFIREFMNAGQGKGIFFGFAPKHVNWQEGTVNGFFLLPGGGWVRRTVPLPDVVYNRLSSRTIEKTTSMEVFKERFIRRDIPLFNWGFFDKWDVYRLLDGDKEAAKHVPESSINPTTAEIQGMMDKHRFVYLKPTGGSLGIGIYRLTYNPGKGYFARFRRKGGNALIRVSSFNGLVGILKRHRIGMQNYVLQQGIRLIEIDGCPIDFRFHMTKNGQNQWVVAGIGAKKAGRGSVTTHVRTGGQLLTPEHVLRIHYGSRAGEVLDNAKETAIRLAETIEDNYSRPLGELGFDIGIDQDERVWMFEANAKPGRSIFKHPSLKEEGKATLTNLIDHCHFLSRFRARRDS
jgi:hypothetical protein